MFLYFTQFDYCRTGEKLVALTRNKSPTHIVKYSANLGHFKPIKNWSNYTTTDKFWFLKWNVFNQLNDRWQKIVTS